MLSLHQSACQQQATRFNRKAAVRPFHVFSTSLKPHAVSRRNAVLAEASMGGKGQGDKKVLRREEEPEEYWVSKGERKGANPMKDPLAIIGLTAIFLPFVLLLVAIATGLVDVSVYK